MKSQFEPNGSPRVAGWRWLDLYKLSSKYAGWAGSFVDRVVYCTAQLNDPQSPQSTTNQIHYISALRATGVTVEMGRYVSRAKEMVMTDSTPGSHSPTPLNDPLQTFTWNFGPASTVLRRRNQDGLMFARVRTREEKGSDVNVAAHLLNDTLSNKIDAAIVITNDSDLALPLELVRQHIPVGLINPQARPLAGQLMGSPTTGAGRHWWRRLAPQDVQSSQLQAQVGQIRKPSGW